MLSLTLLPRDGSDAIVMIVGDTMSGFGLCTSREVNVMRDELLKLGDRKRS